MINNNRKLRVGDYISAPGSPRDYRYGDTVFCPKCNHKSMVFRPRKKLWVCGYSDTNGSKCTYIMSHYVPKKRIVGQTGISGKYRPDGDRLSSDVCGDLVIDVLGEDLALTHLDEMCGDTVGQSRKKSGTRMYESDRMKAYRRKYGG